jgi:hypothetical protein
VLQSPSGRFGAERNHLSQLRIEMRFLDCPAHSLVTLLTKLPGSPVTLFTLDIKPEKISKLKLTTLAL